MAFAYILIIIVSILIVLIVLVQNSKGGGLAAGFAGNQIMGVRKTADFLEKATWGLAGALLFLSVVGTAFIPHEEAGVEGSRVRQQIETAVDPTQVPNFPTTAPLANDSAQ